jgi:hypothetical protein
MHSNFEGLRQPLEPVQTFATKIRPTPPIILGALLIQGRVEFTVFIQHSG